VFHGPEVLGRTRVDEHDPLAAPDERNLEAELEPPIPFPHPIELRAGDLRVSHGKKLESVLRDHGRSSTFVCAPGEWTSSAKAAAPSLSGRVVVHPPVRIRPRASSSSDRRMSRSVYVNDPIRVISQRINSCDEKRRLVIVQAEEHDGAARPHTAQRVALRRGSADAVDDEIRAAWKNLGNTVLARRHVRTERASLREPLRVQCSHARHSAPECAIGSPATGTSSRRHARQRPSPRHPNRPP
jgi:hypothetical protein